MPTPSELDNGRPRGSGDSSEGSKVRNGPTPLTLVVLCVGLAVTGLLTWVTYSINVHNEDRLLRLQTRQAATILAGAVPTIQTPLASAVEIAGASVVSLPIQPRSAGRHVSAVWHHMRHIGEGAQRMSGFADSGLNHAACRRCHGSGTRCRNCSWMVGSGLETTLHAAVVCKKVTAVATCVPRDRRQYAPSRVAMLEARIGDRPGMSPTREV